MREGGAKRDSGREGRNCSPLGPMVGSSVRRCGARVLGEMRRQKTYYPARATTADM